MSKSYQNDFVDAKVKSFEMVGKCWVWFYFLKQLDWCKCNLLMEVMLIRGRT